MEPQQEVVVKPVERPHSMSWKKTAKSGWEPDTLKVYLTDAEVKRIQGEPTVEGVVELMAAMDATARQGNGWDIDTKEPDNEPLD